MEETKAPHGRPPHRAFAFGFGDGIPPDSDVSSEKSVSVQKRFPKHRSHPNLLWVLPPLCRFGDEVLDALVGEASRTVALETAAFGRRFAAGLETRSDAEEATRALRRARRCLGSAIGAFVQLLPKPVASTHASSLLRRYANEVVENAFAVSDVSRDACERARDALREAFSSSGVLPLAILSEDSEVKTTLDERRERTEALFVEILKRAPSATRAAWSKGAATGSLFETSLGDIGEGASLRHAVQLLTPASVLAKTNGRDEIAVGDLEEVGELFLDAKASAKILTEQAAKYLS